MSLYWSWSTSARHQWNRFGSDSSGTRVPTISFGLITQCHSTRIGLQRNRMETPLNHAVTCGLGTPIHFLTSHPVTGMIGVVGLVRPVVLSARGCPNWRANSTHDQSRKYSAIWRWDFSSSLLTYKLSAGSFKNGKKQWCADVILAWK